MIARSEAHDSGLCAATNAERRRFATDPLNLTLAAPAVNRYEKIGKDSAEWLPRLNQCWFAGRVIQVRQRYRLTIDRGEARALDQVLTGCNTTPIDRVQPGSGRTNRSTARSGGAEQRGAQPVGR